MAEVTPAPRTAWAQVMILALPVMGEMMLHTLVWIVDTAMVGRLGAEALSAVGLGAHIGWSAVFVVGALGVGTTALVARCTGAGEHEEGRLVAGQAITLAALVSAVLAVVAWLGFPLLFHIADLGPEVYELGVRYGRTIALGMPFALVGIVICGVLRGTGDTRSPMIAVGLGNLFNVVMDYALIFGRLGFPRLGVFGAALASFGAQVLMLVVVVVFLCRRSGLIALGLSDLWPLRGHALRRLTSISAPAGLETALLDGARAFNLLVISALGTVPFAAFQVTIAAESLSFMPGYAFAVAASILAGQSLGAGDPGRARMMTGVCVKIALGIMSVMAAVFLLVPHWLVSLFTPDVMVTSLAARCLRIAAVMQPAIAIGEVYRGTLRGAGDTRTPLRITIIGSWLVRVPLTILLVRGLGWGITAVFWVIVTEWWVRALLMRLAYVRGNWTKTVV